MYTVTRAPRQVWWPVRINIPVDGGKTERHECEVLLSLMNNEQINALNTVASDNEVIEKLLGAMHGWRDIEDEQGNPLPFDEEIVRAMLKDLYFAKAVIFAINQASSGAAVIKN